MNHKELIDALIWVLWGPIVVGLIVVCQEIVAYITKRKCNDYTKRNSN